MATKKKTVAEEVPSILPLLSVDNFVASPMIPQPIKIDTEEQRKCMEACMGKHAEIFIGTTVNHEAAAKPGDNQPVKLLQLGIIAIAERILEMPGAPTLAFVRPLCRAKFENIVFNPKIPMVNVHPIKNINEPKRLSEENKYLLEHVEELFKQLMQYVGDPERMAAEKLLSDNTSTPLMHLYAMAHVAPISWEEKYQILEANTYKQLLMTMAFVFDQADQKIKIQAAIHERTHIELTKQQKETFLRQHLKHIKEELGERDESDDMAELIAKASQKNWDEPAKEHFNKEFQKLQRLNINNPEYSVQYSYLESLLELPWKKYADMKFSLDKVEEVLNRDHYGLEKVKERILEYMAVVKLRDDLKAPILCLYGPPGVGKTSIGKSVAEATGREYARIALGGLHDEAEIRGHRRTYIGAMPGRFLHALSKCKFGNPLILLDEIDKVGKDYKGDPSSALLEALDPEQNHTFHDNFIDYPYDLSKVLFIATANDISSIPAPLLDRMEIIEMKGYSQEEKREIAIRHLIDKALEDNGFKKGEIKFSSDSIDFIIQNFTKEKGVRQLAKALNRIIRKLALLKVKGLTLPPEVTPDLVKSYLDKTDFRTSSPYAGFAL